MRENQTQMPEWIAEMAKIQEKTIARLENVETTMNQERQSSTEDPSVHDQPSQSQEPQDTQIQPPKRGRGRPRKRPINEVDDLA